MPRKSTTPEVAPHPSRGPSNKSLAEAPENYAAEWEDAARASRYSVIRDPNLHYSLYGYAQGRDYLLRLKQGVKRVIVIAPSYLKQCGIGEYGRYIASQFEKMEADVTIVRTSTAVLAMDDDDLRQALVLVNHGPGLFDGLNPRLSQGESTATLIHNLIRLAKVRGAIPVIIHHSLLDSDHHLLFSRQAQLLAAPIAKVSFVSSGARHFFMTALELGVSPVKVPDHEYQQDRIGKDETIGFFGFFQYGGKDFDALLHLANELRAKLVGSVATVNTSEVDKLRSILDDGGVEHDLSTGWITDEALMDRLVRADYFYLPQNDYDHWNNSATARFVTQIDRPLFLPPHHPFLDMADGAIFATKHDLPRVTAAIREPRRYSAAVKRVQAFRERAAMLNTARALMNELPQLLEQMGDLLVVGENQLSYERLLELPESARIEFREAIGALDPEKIIQQCPSPWRIPAPLEFWRKHYELGDLLAESVLESVHLIYLAICKRPPNFLELDSVIESAKKGASGTEAINSAIVAALESRGGSFHEPEIVFLENGEIVDWESQIRPERIAEFLNGRASRRGEVARILKTIGADGSEWRPVIRNLTDLLVLPAEEIRRRRAVANVSMLDFEWILSPRRLIDRLNRLVACAATAGVSLEDDFVFDLPIPGPIEPKVVHYVVQDFIYLDGDLFVLHAVRCLYKRDPLPLEVMVLSVVLQSHGKRAVLRYLAARITNTITLAGLLDPEEEALEDDFPTFLTNIRDPLFGLIEARNSYEVTRRMNDRWWIANRGLRDELWKAAGSDVKRVVSMYSALDVEVCARKGRSFGESAIESLLQDVSRFSEVEAMVRLSAHVRLGETLVASKENARALRGSLHNFFDFERSGVWSRGGKCRIDLVARGESQLQAAVQTRLELVVGFFGSKLLGPRILELTLRCQAIPYGPSETVASVHVVAGDADQKICIDCPRLRDGALLSVELSLGSTISPKAVGSGADARELGILLRSVALVDGFVKTSEGGAVVEPMLVKSEVGGGKEG